MKIDDVKKDIKEAFKSHIRTHPDEVFTASELGRLFNTSQSCARHHIVKCGFQSYPYGNLLFFGTNKAIEKLKERLK